MRPILCLLTGLITALFMTAPTPPTWAAVINVDVDLPGDLTHSGADGALSSSGSLWNAVVYNVDAAGLADEMGNATPVGVTYLRSTAPSPFLDFAAMNDLQDTGMTGEGFEIRRLDPASRYSLVMYTTMGATFNLAHAGGNTGGGCSSAPPTYQLPGTMGQDYCRFDDLIPMELTPGVYGIRVFGLFGAVTGFQLQGTAPPDPEPVDTTAPSCVSSWRDGTPPVLEVRIADEESGVASIQVLQSENAVVDIATFTPGTTEPVVLAVSAVDPYVLARVTLGSSDAAGNEASCEFEIPALPTPPPPPPPPGDEACSTPETCCAELVGYYRSARTEGGLRGRGPGRSGEAHRRVMERALERACDFIHDGATEEACSVLQQALRRTDGRAIPPDLVEGPMSVALAQRIQALREMLGCTGSSSSPAPAGARLRPTSEEPFVAPTTWGMLKSLYGSEE